MARDLAIVLNNGSVNSAVTTALAAQKYRTVMLYVDAEANLGSRAKQAYDLQVAHFKPYREHTVQMPFLDALHERPAPQQPPSDPRQVAPVAPQLTALLPLIAAGVSYAAHYQAAAIYVGLRVGPGSDELAPATEFAQIWSELIQTACGLSETEVVTPLLELEPWQVVDVGFQSAAPFERTWSCFDDGNEPCWACRLCRAREAAFTQAGKSDPLRAVKGVRG
jgi:7-cyano-7-deazaguanine synthase